MAYNLVTKANQTFSNAALVHQGAGEHESGDTQQGKRIQARKKPLCKHIQGHAFPDKINQRGNTQAESNGNTGRQTYCESDK